MEHQIKLYESPFDRIKSGKLTTQNFINKTSLI